MKTEWRQHLPEGWTGDRPSQYCVPSMKFSTIMKVPSTKNGRLIKALSRSEPRLAKVTGYQTKYVESSGRALSKFFPKGVVRGKCHRRRCPVCSNTECKGPTLCQVKSVVYMGVCTICDQKHKANPSSKHLGRYIGQTSRTLAERAGEHLAGLRRLDLSCHLVKHWAISHPELLEPPSYRFSVVKPKVTQCQE